MISGSEQTVPEAEEALAGLQQSPHIEEEVGTDVKSEAPRIEVRSSVCLPRCPEGGAFMRRIKGFSRLRDDGRD